MDRSKVRIGLITIGIIASLTLLLYLPVLIWSPPWGINGYYTLEHDRGYYINYFYNSHLNQLHAWYPYDDFNSESWDLTQDPDNSSTWIFQKYPDYSIKFSDNYYEQFDASAPSTNSNIMKNIKTTNPFTLWYIKWLEWSV